MNNVETLNNMVSYNFANYAEPNKKDLCSTAKKAISETDLNLETKDYLDYTKSERIEFFRKIRSQPSYCGTINPKHYKDLLKELLIDVENDLKENDKSDLTYEEIAYILVKLN